MKKITTLLLLLVAALILVVAPAYADEEALIDIYPYGSINNMTETEPIAGGTLRVGTSNWTLDFLGYRYHFVRSSVRYGHQFVDANADGVFEATEYPGVSYSAFAAMTINNTEDEMELVTTNLRANITGGVTNRIYAYFNEDMELAMFEDHIFTYHIFNDGTDVTDNADWRFATEAEIDAFKAAADPLTETPNTRLAHVRVVKDTTDAQGYKLEPLGYLTWLNPDLGALPAEERSLLVDWNPNHVVIPAGWTAVSFGQHDRGSYKATDFVKVLYTAFVAETTPVAVSTYTYQNPVFAGLTAHDDDAVTPGVQMIVEYNQADFDLPNNVSVSWLKMFEDDVLVNKTEKLSYKVDVYETADFNSAEEDHVPTILETITFTYDSVADAYTPDKALSVVDSSVFGAGYTAVYSATHAEDGLTEIIVDIAVGVLPPRFENVKNRYVDESVFVDLLGDVTANDGYGNDKTGDIKITAPAGFNIYNPKPGTYKIDLEFTHHVHIAGEPTVPDRITLGSKVIDVTRKNQNFTAYGLETTLYTEPFLYTNTSFQGWIVVEFDKDGKMIQSVARNTWEAWGASGAIAGMSDAGIKAWLEGIDFSLGGFVVFFGQTADRPLAQALRYGDQVTFTEGSIGTPDFNADIVTKASYNLTVDDKTAPQTIVVNNNLTIEADAFASAEAAILSNIVAVDNYDARTQLSLFVLNNGGLSLASGKLSVGTYTVTVGVEDRAGNASEVTYTLTVKAAKPTQEEVDQKVDDKVEDVEAQIPQDTITPDQVEEAIKDALDSYDGVSVLTAVLMSLGAALVSFGGAALLFFLKKK
ncbi:hypothetical protein HXW96_04360 [Acholeplasma laidlawii]|uniref:hypothetical protein n=1 Tax=Acholeplasma laidlawii TaxID=2148 RepID=UPI0015AB47C6|nr:hypothetical protein [Acholeplasma laidlawii]NWH11932.1 hypothetical protein [Acholeplasma laidlawii]